VRVTNNIVGTASTTPATVNQCVGSGATDPGMRPRQRRHHRRDHRPVQRFRKRRRRTEPGDLHCLSIDRDRRVASDGQSVQRIE
jgi:hypothetical protein